MSRRFNLSRLGFGIVCALAFFALSAGIARADGISYQGVEHPQPTYLRNQAGAEFNALRGLAFPNSDSQLFGSMISVGDDASSAPLLDIQGMSQDSSAYTFACPASLKDCVLVSDFNTPAVESVGGTALVIDVNGVSQSVKTPYHTPVPEPSSIILIGSALVGFVGVVRRRLLV